MCFLLHAKAVKDKAKYLLIKLCLRKTDRWLKLADLKYQRELGEDGILEAMRELCGDPAPDPTTQPETVEDTKPNAETKPGVIDLTIEDENEAQDAAVHPSELGTAHLEEAQLRAPDYTYLALSANGADLVDLLDCLPVPELRDLIKKMKLTCKDNQVSPRYRPARME